MSFELIRDEVCDLINMHVEESYYASKYPDYEKDLQNLVETVDALVNKWNVIVAKDYGPEEDYADYFYELDADK